MVDVRLFGVGFADLPEPFGQVELGPVQVTEVVGEVHKVTPSPRAVRPRRLGSPRVAVRTVPLVMIEVPVVKRHEDHALPYAADAGLRLEPPARRLDAHHIALPHAETLCVRRRELDPGIRRGALKLRDTSGLRAGVEVVDRAAGSVAEGVFLPRLLVRRLVLGGEQERPSGGRLGLVLHFRALRPRQEVAAVGLAVVGLGVEVTLGVETLGAVGVLVVAGPLDTAAISELVVGDPGIVAGPTTRALLPSFEGAFRIVPSYEGLPVFVPEIHASGVVEEDVKVTLRFARGLDGLLREVHRAIRVRESTRLLAPGCGGKHYFGVLR